MPPPPPPPNMAPPPGYVPYGGPMMSAGYMGRIGGLTKWLVALLIGSLVLNLLSLLGQLFARDAAADFLEGAISAGEFNDKLVLFGIAALVGLAVSIGQIVVLCIWTYRMIKNHDALGRHGRSFSPGGSIAVNLLGGCTLGILNFFMWREIWKGADPDTAPGDPSWKQRAASVLPGIQLGLTLAGVAAGIGLGVANSGFTTIRINNQSNVDLAEPLEDQFALIALSGALGIAASVVFIMYVRQVAARHMKATREA